VDTDDASGDAFGIGDGSVDSGDGFLFPLIVDLQKGYIPTYSTKYDFV
jgi:hypothetical protein